MPLERAFTRPRYTHPEAYLTDVLMRLLDQPAAAIDDLLPANWAPAAVA